MLEPELRERSFLPPGEKGRLVRYAFGAGWLLLAVSAAVADGPHVSLRYYELVAQIFLCFGW